MRINRVKLSAEEKKCVDKWLKLTDIDKGIECPFFDCRGMFDCIVCHYWFPACSTSDLKCPCDHYSLKEVIKRAKEMIKE